MDAVEAIGMALTPGTVFNQQNKVFRSAKALAQFANVPQNEVLGLIADNLADRVTIRPSAKRPESGPLIALTEFLPLQEEPALVQIIGGNAVEPEGMGVEAGAPAAGGFGVMPLGVEAGGAAALMQKVNAITGHLDEDDQPDEDPPGYHLLDEKGDEEVVAVEFNGPNDEEVA